MKKLMAAALLTAALTWGSRAAAAELMFTQVAIDYQGTKVWVPGTIIVHKGDKVTVQLINNIPSDPATHGFAIDEYKVKKSIARGKTETVEFTASKEGVFTIYCHQHPKHVGGQLLVLP